MDVSPHKQLATLADEYFRLAMSADPFEASMNGIPGYDHLVPDPSREADQRQAADRAELASRLAELDPDQLTGPDTVTYTMLARLLRDERDRRAAGLSEVAVSGTIAGHLSNIIGIVPQVPIGDESAARAYLDRLAGLGDYFDAVAHRHREAAADGRFPTALGVRQAIDQVDDYLAGPVEGDPLASPGLPASVDADQWYARAREIIAETFRPAVRRYRDTLATELLPNGRDDDHVGVCHVPGGADGYRIEARAHTTTDLTPEEVHELGHRLVDGLRAEFAELGGRALGTTDVAEVLQRLREDPNLRFQTAGEIVTYATDALRRAEAALPGWFRDYAIAPCVVREMSEVEAKGSVLGYYLPPAADGSRPGAHCVNTYQPHIRPRFEYEALAFHESVPGHHLQIALGQSLTGLPDFRRFAYITAHSEGWGLYAERLSDEMGLYTDELSRLGMVSFDAWRACRLVVDTGMHHLGWSRSQAVAFMRDNTALSYANIDNEVDRYIAYPGQALAYMVGRIRIDELRQRAQSALGSDFDIVAFHDHVLGNGAVPLDALEQIIDQWILRTHR